MGLNGKNVVSNEQMGGEMVVEEVGVLTKCQDSQQSCSRIEDITVAPPIYLVVIVCQHLFNSDVIPARISNRAK